jgi:hypothetical protein
MRGSVLIAARALTGAAMLISTAYLREVMVRENGRLLSALCWVGMIVGLGLYTQLCIAEGERRAMKRDGSRGVDPPSSAS